MKILALMMVFFSVIMAEKIYLKSGDVITGKIRGYEGNSAIIKTSYGEIKIDRDQIIKVEFGTTTQPKTEVVPSVVEIR